MFQLNAFVVNTVSGMWHSIGIFHNSSHPPISLGQHKIILEDFENASPYFCTIVYAIDTLLAGFNVQPRNGMNQSFI